LKKEGCKPTEILKKTGTEWKTLSQKEKKPYEDATAAAKAEYEALLAEYKGSDEAADDAAMRIPKKTKADKDLEKKMLKNQPKRPKNGYMLFADEKRPEVMKSLPGVKVSEIAKKIGDMWAAASDKDKAPYQKQYEADKKAYAKKIEAYKKSDEYLAYEQAKR